MNIVIDIFINKVFYALPTGIHGKPVCDFLFALFIYIIQETMKNVMPASRVPTTIPISRVPFFVVNSIYELLKLMTVT